MLLCSGANLSCRWLVGVSYRVSFGADPIANAGGGMFGSFASVPGAIHLDEDGDMEVRLHPERTCLAWRMYSCSV